MCILFFLGNQCMAFKEGDYMFTIRLLTSIMLCPPPPTPTQTPGYFYYPSPSHLNSTIPIIMLQPTNFSNPMYDTLYTEGTSDLPPGDSEKKQLLKNSEHTKLTFYSDDDPPDTTFAQQHLLLLEKWTQLELVVKNSAESIARVLFVYIGGCNEVHF